MDDDRQVLEELNVRIGDAESSGDIAWLVGILAPEFAFRRASGTVDGAIGFVKGIKRSEPRTTEFEPIELYGNRAVVKCIVTMKTAEGDKRYHNLRLFIKHEGEWKLLAWANEPA